MSQDEAPAIAEEYASFTISIDHLVTDPREDGHTVVKSVSSTESAVQALLSQISYFEQTHLLTNPATGSGNVDMIAKANHKATIFIFTPGPGLVNVIVDAAIYNEMMDPSTDTAKALNPQGTVLGAHASLITLATDLKRAAANEGKPDNLLAFITE